MDTHHVAVIEGVVEGDCAVAAGGHQAVGFPAFPQLDGVQPCPGIRLQGCKVVFEQGPAAVDARLRALDKEWDIERCLETGASSLTLIGTVLGATVNKKWFWLPGGVAAFLLQHALQGWCPPLPVFRRLGVRTADEINRERHALLSVKAKAPSSAMLQSGTGDARAIGA